MLVSKADKWFSIFIRLRDSDDKGFCTCVTCGAIRFWKNLDCGHWIKRQHMATRFNEKNCAAQCKPCNAFEQGRDADFERYIIKKYGQQTRNLLRAGIRMNVKHTSFEIDLLTKEYKEKATELAKSKGLEI